MKIHYFHIGGSNMTFTPKWTQIKLDSVTHAYLKAEAVINNQTIPDYIAGLIKQDLQQKGYKLDRSPILVKAAK